MNLIEFSIPSRQVSDTLPVNQNINNRRCHENNLEFRVHGLEGQSLDLSTLMIELDISLVKIDGITKLGVNDHATQVNGLGASVLFKSAS